MYSECETYLKTTCKVPLCQMINKQRHDTELFSLIKSVFQICVTCLFHKSFVILAPQSRLFERLKKQCFTHL